MGEEFSVMFKGHYSAEVVVCMVTECHFSDYLIPERETQLCSGGSADTALTHVITADVANRCSVPPEVVWYAAPKTSEQPESRSCASCWM